MQYWVIIFLRLSCRTSLPYMWYHDFQKPIVAAPCQTRRKPGLAPVRRVRPHRNPPDSVAEDQKQKTRRGTSPKIPQDSDWRSWRFASLFPILRQRGCAMSRSPMHMWLLCRRTSTQSCQSQDPTKKPPLSYA